MEKDILSRLDALAAKLGVTAELLWDSLVAGRRIEAIAELVLLLLVTIAVIVFSPSVWRRVKGIEEEEAQLMVQVALVFGVGLLAMVWLIESPSLIRDIAVPEACAAKMILEMI